MEELKDAEQVLRETIFKKGISDREWRMWFDTWDLRFNVIDAMNAYRGAAVNRLFALVGKFLTSLGL